MMNTPPGPSPDLQEAGRIGAAGSDELATLREELVAAQRKLAQAERTLAVSRERERLLGNELDHRVRNMLSNIRSIFSRTLEAGRSVDPAALEQLGDHFRGRLDTLARFQVAHGLDPHGTFYLEDIVRDELLSFEFDERVTISGDEVTLANTPAQSLGLAIHELATNAIKFGALSTSDHRTGVTISWTCVDSVLTLTWAERGVAVLSAAPFRSGFGREFIEQALPYQTAATTSFDLKPGGLICIITVQVGDQMNRRLSD